jgi:formylglycine-generating enzyme required for sulfatase activity
LIVFVDQLEELITLGDPAEVAVLDAGFQALSEGVDGVRLLATARADFLARISNLPGLGRDLARTLYFLRPLPPERLRDVIVGPAEAVGVRFESDAIVDELVAATAQTGSGGLPLLSFALADLWEARDRERDMITRSAVAEMGGVAGALSRHADVVIGGMVAGRRDARRVLLRLVSAMGTRARRSASELALGDSGRSALDALVSGRLVVVHDSEPEPVYELAHECLITGWTKLREWLDADAARRGTRERLAAAAAEWLRLGRRSDATWQGKRLDEAAALEPESLSGDDLAFLAASQHARRWRRRLRWLAAIGVIALVALAFATQRYIARRELTAAVAEELTPAGEALGKARAASRELNRLERAAFQKFDAANSSGEKRKDAEAAWKEVVALRQDADRAYREAGQYVEIALAKDPTRSDVRDRLGDILIERATLAEHVRDLALRDELIGRLEPYDADGSRRALWNAHGTLVVRVPATAQVKLESTRPPVSLRSVPLAGGVASESLAPGSYVVVVSAPGHAVVRAPVVIERGREFDLAIAPPRAADVPDGYVYIPRGKFLFGHANEIDRKTFFNTTPLRPRETEAFLIGRTEITFAEWLAWIDSLPPDEQTARLPSVPDRLSGSIKLTADATGHWRIELQPVTDVYTAGWDERIVYRGRDRRIAQDWRKFPVTGISADDAAAYAAWLAQTGRLPGARLCSEVEWERAARGADDRAYPGGGTPELDDINVDDTYGQALRGPDEVGSHPASNSPFGLEDMSGNALECTVGEDGGFILRGGGYWYDRKSAQVTNRAPFDRIVREASLGLRLCATPTPALPE